MLRVTVSVVPYGVEDAVFPIGRLEIVNDGTTVNDVANYKVTQIDIDPIGDGYSRHSVRTATQVRHHARSDGAWELLRKALEACQQEV